MKKTRWMSVLYAGMAALFFLAGLSGCKVKGSSSPAEVDVNGIWGGTWQGEGETGKVLLDLVQSGSTISGSIYLYNDLPSLANVGTRIKGSVSENEVTFQMDSANYDHCFTGTVDNGVIQGSIKYFKKKGTWSANRIPSGSFDAVATIPSPVQCPAKLASDGRSLLVYDCTTRHVVSMDFTGNILSTVTLENTCQCGMAIEGNTLFYTDGSSRIFCASIVNGKTIDQISAPFDVSGIACAPELFYVIRFMTGEVSELTRQGVANRSFSNFRYVNAITYGGEHIWLLQSLPAVLEYDSHGDLVAAYRIPLADDGNHIINLCLTFDGECFWMSIDEYSDDHQRIGSNLVRFKASQPK